MPEWVTMCVGSWEVEAKKGQTDAETSQHIAAAMDAEGWTTKPTKDPKVWAVNFHRPHEFVEMVLSPDVTHDREVWCPECFADYPDDWPPGEYISPCYSCEDDDRDDEEEDG